MTFKERLFCLNDEPESDPQWKHVVQLVIGEFFLGRADERSQRVHAFWTFLDPLVDAGPTCTVYGRISPLFGMEFEGLFYHPQVRKNSHFGVDPWRMLALY